MKPTNYKPTNTHDYLPYDSVHPDHAKNNIPYNLVKRIIVFGSTPEKVIIRLDELRQFLKECKYPEHVISKSIFNAKLQGPATNQREVKVLFHLLQPIILISTTNP